MTHYLKIDPVYLNKLIDGSKTFELRKNDKGYKEGDRLHLMEFKAGEYTGRRIVADITYMLEEYSGIEEGYCILGIKVKGEANEG